MNLNILPIPVMVATTGEWIADPVLTAEMTAHSLGAELWKEIRRIHDEVVASSNERMSLEALLAALIERINDLDGVHDRKARALRNLLIFLAEATDDADLARKLHELDALLFPQQLRIVQLPYREEVGEVMQVEKRVTPAVLATLRSVRVADQTLADVYCAWIQAGKELGRGMTERTRLEASLATAGTIAPRMHTRKIRTRWIRGVRLLLDAVDVLGLSDDARERLLAPLEKSIADAQQRRAQSGQGNVPDIEPGDVDDDIDDIDGMDDADDMSELGASGVDSLAAPEPDERDHADVIE